MPNTTGAIKRTMLTPCNKSIKGSVREVKQRFLTHQKVCSTCASLPYGNTPVSFSPDNRLNNGMDGIHMSRRGHLQIVPQRMIKVVSSEMGIHQIMVKDVHSTEEVLKNVRTPKE